MSEANQAIPSVGNRILDFAQLLRANEYTIEPGCITDAMQVAADQILHDHNQLRLGFKSCFCKTPDQWKKFDKLFFAFWADRVSYEDSKSNDVPGGGDITSSQNQRMVGLAGTSSEKEQSVNVYGSGDYTALSLADFRFVFNPAEKILIDQYVDELAQRCRRRHIKKSTLSDKGSRVALSKSIQQSLRYQGKVFNLRFHKRQKKLPGFVLLLDISQSMDVYARLFLRFTRKLLSVFETSHAFAFNVELIDLGKGFYSLEESHFEHAINTASQGWVGGTRIARSFEEFNKNHLSSLVKSHTTILIFSDGCDTDTPGILAGQLKTMAHKARRVVWVNPLKGRFAEEHIETRMQPLQPYISDYLSAHNLPSLLKLQSVLLN